MATSASPAEAPPVMAEAPERTETGRLGMTRTTRAPGSAASSVASVTPAAMETTRAPSRSAACCSSTGASTCGFTASTTMPGLSASISADVEKVRTPACCASAASLPGLWSHTSTCSPGRAPDSTRPRAMEPPMDPAPMMATV